MYYINFIKSKFYIMFLGTNKYLNNKKKKKDSAEKKQKESWQKAASKGKEKKKKEKKARRPASQHSSEPNKAFLTRMRWINPLFF